MTDTRAARLLAHRRITATNCWEWTLSTKPNGYGQIRVGNRTRYTHREAWDVWRGPVPTGKVLDHLCRNRLCFNPDHLEPVTTRENNVRGVGPIGTAARYVDRDTCGRGHTRTPDNAVPRYEGRGWACRTCLNERRRRYYAARVARQRQEVAA